MSTENVSGAKVKTITGNTIPRTESNDGDEVLQRPGGTWTHKPSHAFLDTFSITLEQHLSSTRN